MTGPVGAVGPVMAWSVDSDVSIFYSTISVSLSTMSRISATCGASAGGGGAAVKIGGCVIGIISSSDTKDVVEYTTSVSSYVRVVYSKHANIADRATMYPMSKPVPFSFSGSAFGDFFTSLDYIYFLVIISFGAKSCAGSEP